MKNQRTKPVEFLGTYILPAISRNADDQQPIEAFVVLHVGITPESKDESTAPHPQAVSTAIIFVGKRDVIKMGNGTHQEHELVGLAGVSQPASKQ
jgi:hypothetical protein